MCILQFLQRLALNVRSLLLPVVMAMDLLSQRAETNFYVIVPRDTEIDRIPLYLERRFFTRSLRANLKTRRES